MRYFRDSTQKYDTEYTHAWRLNDDGSVDFRDSLEGDWSSANILISDWLLEEGLYAGDIEECNDPFKEYDCRNDS